MRKAYILLLLASSMLAACSHTPKERAEVLATRYNNQYDLFVSDCRKSFEAYAADFQENVSVGRYENRKSAFYHIDSLLGICQQDYTSRLTPIEEEYRNLVEKRYRLLGEYRQQFVHTFDSIVRHRADDTTRVIDSIKNSPELWALLNSITDPPLPSKEEMSAQLVGQRIACSGDPYFHDSSYVLAKGHVEVECIRLVERHFNSETGNNNVPVDIVFQHSNKEFKGTVWLNYELHDGDLDWQLRSISGQHITFQPNHAYDKYVQSKVCDDGSFNQRLHLINRSNRSVLVGYWVKYKKRFNFFRQDVTDETERKLIRIPPAPNNKLVVDLHTFKPSAVDGGVAFVILE